MKGSPLAFGLLFLFLALAGCGEQSNGLTSADVAYIRAKRYQDYYGSAVTNSTSTVSSVVTITSTTTVSATTVN